MASKGSLAFKTRKTDDNWKKIQERTFTNWFNDRLRGNLKVAKKQVSEINRVGLESTVAMHNLKLACFFQCFFDTVFFNSATCTTIATFTHVYM